MPIKIENVMNRVEHANNEYVKSNYSEAFEIYLLESSEGNLECSRLCGWMYLYGQGVKVNIEKALELFETAAQKGDCESVFGKVKCLIHMRDFETSTSLLRELCKQDYAPAHYMLGKLYLSGKWLERDRSLALYHFSQAAKQKHLYASRKEALMLMSGDKGFFFRFVGLWKFVGNIVNAIDIALGKGNRDPRWLT